MPRMPGKVRPSWCPVCNGTPGFDCPDIGKPPRWTRRQLKDALRRNPEDQ